MRGLSAVLSGFTRLVPAAVARGAHWGLLDQALSSGTNFAVAFVVVRRVDAAEFGAFSLVSVLYVIAVCGALLASSHRALAGLGVVNLVVTPLLMWLTISGFVSLWCFWAAIASVVIAFHLRRVARTRDAGRDDRHREDSEVAARSS